MNKFGVVRFEEFGFTALHIFGSVEIWTDTDLNLLWDLAGDMLTYANRVTQATRGRHQLAARYLYSYAKELRSGILWACQNRNWEKRGAYEALDLEEEAMESQLGRGYRLS